MYLAGGILHTNIDLIEKEILIKSKKVLEKEST